MADPLSVTASVVGIIVPALHGTRQLLDDLQEIKNAPKTIQRLTDEVHSVYAALELLQGVEDRDLESLGEGVAKQSEATIRSCTQACNLFKDDLERWTRHKDGKLALLDQANIGFFKKNQVKAISEQLQSCKLAINLVVGVATLYSSVRNSHLTEDIKKTISTKQNKVKDAMITTDKQLLVLENRVEEINLSDEDEEVVTSAEGKTKVLRQLEEELEGVKASQKLLNELLSKSQEDAVAKAAGNQNGSTTVTFGAQNLGFQAGNINGGVSGISFGGK